MKLDINIPQMLLPVWKPSRYKILYGGRASGKSIAICYFLLTQAMQRKCKILCTREYQASIKESTYAVFKALIDKHDLYPYFTIKYDSILGVNGSEFIFKGLARDIYSIKSMYDLDYCFVEEAENIDVNTWNVLIPTIREEGSEMLVAFNPKDKTSETYQRFVENTPANAIKIKINYHDIRSFLSKTILDEIENLKINNYALYEHIYLGEPLDATEDVIFKGRFEVKDCNIERYNNGWRYQGKYVAPLYGLDFGFSVDPMAVVEVFFLDKNTLYIAREIYEHHLLPNKYIETIKQKMPEAINAQFIADSSRPDSIAQLSHDGLYCVPCMKGKGSVESGIEFLKGKKIYIHPNCKNTIYEFFNYKYKTDKNSGKITTDIIDANNHACLTGDTLINTEHGQIRIDNLINQTGMVWSFNENTQQAELNKFDNVTITNYNAEIYQIELEDGRIIKGTADHPCLTQRGWIQIQNLLSSDYIIDISNTINQYTALKVVPVKCIGIKKITRLNNELVYNMSVENVHNFAINGGLIVHNCDALRYALHEQIQSLKGGLQFTQEDLAYFSQPHEIY